MIILKKRGYNLSHLKQSVMKQAELVNQFQFKLNELTNKKGRYTFSLEQALGVLSLKTEIDHLKASKKTFIADFDSEKSIRQRKAEHRKQYLQEHN